METVGLYLKKEREARNISLKEVSRMTKISEIYLDCIEKDDYEKLPQGPYIKGYISTYSRLIGSDVEEALKLYDSLHRKNRQPDPVQPDIPPDKGWKSSIVASLNSIVSSFNGKNRNGGQQRIAKSKPRVWKMTAGKPVEGREAPADGQTTAATDEPQARPMIPLNSLSTAIDAGRAKAGRLVSASASRAASVKRAGTAARRTTATALREAASVMSAAGASLSRTAGRATAGLGKAASSVAGNRLFTQRRTWMVATPALLVGALILVLAGVGVYHLAVLEDPVPAVDEGALKVDAQPTTAAAPTAAAAVKTPAPAATPPRPPTGEVRNDRPTTAAADPAAQRPHLSPKAEKPASPPKPAVEPAAGPAPPKPAAVTQKTAAKPAAPVAAQLPPPAVPRPEAHAGDGNLNVLKASICSRIQDRMPASVDTTFPASVQRVYVWNHIEAKTYPTTVRHIYRLNGQVYNDVSLEVRSPSWRTWSFKSIADERYRGEWQVDIAAEDGTVLRRLFFTIE